MLLVLVSFDVTSAGTLDVTTFNVLVSFDVTSSIDNLSSKVTSYEVALPKFCDFNKVIFC